MISSFIFGGGPGSSWKLLTMAQPLAQDYAWAGHLVVIFELLILVPYTKLAHPIHRPFAIWISRAYHRV